MKNDSGFISWLILIIIALALLRYFFDWSIFDAANSEQGKNTINYIKDVIDVIWSYLKTPIYFIWDQIMTFLPAR